MSGVLDRMEAAVLHVFKTTGQVPAYLHVACDVYHDAHREAKDAMRSFLVYFPATQELLIRVPEGEPVPVREACRLAPGYIVPVMRLEARP